MKNKRDFALWLCQQLDIKTNMSFMTQLVTLEVVCNEMSFQYKKNSSLTEVFFLSGYSMINFFIQTIFIDYFTEKINDFYRNLLIQNMNKPSNWVTEVQTVANCMIHETINSSTKVLDWQFLNERKWIWTMSNNSKNSPVTVKLKSLFG